MATDRGDVKLAVDMSTGFVHVTVRPPLGLESAAVTAATSAYDILDVAAQIQLAMSEQRKAMLSRGVLQAATQ